MKQNKDEDKLLNEIYAALEKQAFSSAQEKIEQLADMDPAAAAALRTSVEIEAGDAAAAARAWGVLAQLKPHDVYTIFLQARIQFMRHEIVSALHTLDKLQGHKLRRPYEEKIANLYGQCCRFLGMTEQAAACYLQAAKAADEQGLAQLEYSDYLFSLHYLRHSLTKQREAAAGYDRLFVHESCFLHAPRHAEQKKLRIGYISPDLRRHVVLQFIYVLFRSYNKERFVVYAYANNPEDGYSQQLKAFVDGWRNIYGLKPQAAAQRIYEDRIDILVDFSGHTKGSCLPILACRPAPIQLSAIGYFASTGLREVDYFLSDRYLAKGEAQAGYTEKLLILAHSHFCYIPLQETVFAGQPPCMHNGFVTFGSFNNFSKVNDEVLQVWSKLLRRLPQARLLLKAEVFDYEESRRFAMDRLRKVGIDLARVECRGLSKEYLLEYREMDIALDTFPYPGGGTTCDALYMGVPVITLAGSSQGERFGVSILQNIGLKELIAPSIQAYLDCAAALAEDKGLLVRLHQNLRKFMQRSFLMDAENYAREIGMAWEKIWQAYIVNQPAVRYREAVQMDGRMRSFLQQGDTTQALAAAGWILEGHPRSPEILERIIMAALDAGEIEMAQRGCAFLQEAVPEKKSWLLWQAEILFLQKEWQSALEMASCFLSLGAGNRLQQGMAHHLCAEIYKQQGKRKLAAEAYHQSSLCKDIESGCLADYSNYLLNLQYASLDQQQLFAASCSYAELLPNSRRYVHSVKRHRHDRLRIGYISPDFCRHVAACFMQVFFQQAERHIFSVYGYMLSRADEVTSQFAVQADVWRDLSECSADEAAGIIYEDEIDILVDFSGHTGHNALPILAQKPAPVQVSGIGYFATTGLSEVDYFLTDVHTAVPGEERYFTEKLLRLSHSHWCYAPLPGMETSPAPAPYGRTGWITFGCLNHFDKVTDTMLQAWAEILRRTPQARLLLKSAVFSEMLRCEEVRCRMVSLGVEAERLLLEGCSESYLDTYYSIDIALDTYPYPGGGTTCDALYMGVPVVTLFGASHHERFGKSLLENAGLAELCTSTLEEYIEQAVLLAQDKKRLRELHRVLRRRLQQTAVMNGALYMQDLEEAYCVIWQEWQKNNEPDMRTRERKALEELRRAFAAADWAEAIRLTFRLAGTEAETEDVPRIAAFAYAQCKDYARAIRWAHNCWQQSSDDEQMMYTEASATEQMGDLPAALRLCKEYLHRPKYLLPVIRRSFLQLRAFIGYKLGSEEMSEYYKAVYDDQPEDIEAYSSWLLTYNSQKVEEDELLQKHLDYGQLFSGVKRCRHTKQQHHHTKLRIGYISPDFRVHVMVHFYLAFFAAFESKEFHVYAYSLTRKPDTCTQQLKHFADEWRDMAGASMEEIAAQIYEDEIDILFDLAGHTAGSGLPALAYQPAPVQVSGLGYMATTGLATVDYFFSDGFVDPPGLNERYFTEKILRVTSQFCYGGISGALPESTGAPMRKRGWLLFGVFNAYRKYTDEMLLAWRKILEQLPTAKILLKSQVFFSPAMIDAVYARFAALEFDMDRVIFEPASTDYMQRYLDVDIALDTYPYPGGGTTCDALYMGVPVVTRYSTRHSTRFSYSILQNVGLGELAVTNMEDYVRCAVRLAQDCELLDLLHKNIRVMMKKSKLMDMGAYMDEVEQNYHRIWAETYEQLPEEGEE